VTAFLLAAWLAASKAGHARYSPVDGRGDNDPSRISLASQQPSRNTFANGGRGNDDGRRTGSNDPRGVGMVEVKPTKAKRLYTWNCQYCGVEFETEKYTKRYCNPTHKQRAYELRREQRADTPADAESL
jgi:hypothetical protein